MKSEHIGEQIRKRINQVLDYSNCAGIMVALLVTALMFRITYNYAYKKDIKSVASSTDSIIIFLICLSGVAALCAILFGVKIFKKRKDKYAVSKRIRKELDDLVKRKKRNKNIGNFVGSIFIISAFIFSVVSPHFIRLSNPVPFLVTELLIGGGGAFILVGNAIFMRRLIQICENEEVVFTDENKSEDSIYHINIVGAVVYGMAAVAMLGSYVGLSYNFKNWITYFPLLIIFAMLLLAICGLYFRKSARLISFSVSGITVRLGVIGIVIMIISNLLLNGVNSNGKYIKEYINSLNYSDFQKNDTVKYDSDTGVYSIDFVSDEFKILQLTDIHFGGEITTYFSDKKAIKACYDLIKQTSPDMVVLTGDTIYPIPLRTLNNDNLSALKTFCTFMENMGVQWVYIYGNHDTEKVASYRADTLNEVFKEIISNGGSVMYSDVELPIYGRSNQYVEVHNRDKSLNRLLFMIDSNDYADENNINDYDVVHEDQINWYKNVLDEYEDREGKIIKSFVFQHIPLPEYQDAVASLENSDETTQYLFGENEESVHCPAINSGFFDAMLEKKSTQAVFCGHDHINYLGVKYNGIDLVYSKSIDYFVYRNIANHDSQRGATLIHLKEDGAYNIEPISYK